MDDMTKYILVCFFWFTMYNNTVEKVAINDVGLLSLKVARRDAIANWTFLGHRDTSDLILIVPFTFAMQRHFFR